MAKISVVIPTYNRADQLDRAVSSVLDQTESDFELLIVDDGSTDNTKELCTRYRDPRVQYFRHETNRGASTARNTGILHAKGKYIAFLDSDDEWKPTKLEKQVAALENRSADWVGAYTDYTPSRSHGLTELIDKLVPRPSGLEGGEELLGPLLTRAFDFGGTSTLLVRRRLFKNIGGFAERLDRQQDLELMIRLLQAGKIVFLSEPLTIRHRAVRENLTAVAESSSHLIDRHEELFWNLEASGYPVFACQRLQVAIQLFREGYFRDGARLASISTVPTKRDIFVICYALQCGFRNRFKDKSGFTKQADIEELLQQLDVIPH